MDGNAHQLLPPQTSQDQISLIIQPTPCPTKSTNSSRPSASRTDSRMKSAPKWLNNKEKKPQDMTTIHALLPTLMLDLEELHQPWSSWNCSLRPVLQACTLRTRDPETRNAVTWVARSLFPPESTLIELLLSDSRLILWTLNLLSLPEPMLSEPSSLIPTLTPSTSPTFWESAQTVN